MYRVGIVGGETHIQEVTQLRGQRLEICGIAVREHLATWAREQFGVTVYPDFRQLLDREPLDVVAVANENDEKAMVVVEALRRGMHVIVDKPMALTLDELAAIETEARNRQRRILMLLTMRGDPWYRAVREVVRSGRIGEPVQVYGKMSVPLKPAERPPWFLDSRRSGGPILDLAIHTFDQLEWATGRRLTRVTATEGNVSHPEMAGLIDSGVELFALDNGGTAIVEQNRVGLEYDYRFDVVGTAGQVNLLHNRALRIQTAEGWQELHLSDLGKAQSVVEDWLTSLPDGDALISNVDSFRASRVACIAKQAAATGATLSTL